MRALQHGYTPLHQATQQDHLNVISVLLTNGASPDCVTNVSLQSFEQSDQVKVKVKGSVFV